MKPIMPIARPQPSGAAAITPVQRVQRRRSKGYHSPDNTRYCGRPSKYANPFVIGGDTSRADALDRFGRTFWKGQLGVTPEVVRAELAQYDYLSCWCSVDEDCHVDAYIEALTCVRCRMLNRSIVIYAGQVRAVRVGPDSGGWCDLCIADLKALQSVNAMFLPEGWTRR